MLQIALLIQLFCVKQERAREQQKRRFTKRAKTDNNDAPPPQCAIIHTNIATNLLSIVMFERVHDVSARAINSVSCSVSETFTRHCDATQTKTNNTTMARHQHARTKKISEFTAH